MTERVTDGVADGLIARLPLASWRLFVATCAVLGVGFAATELDLWWEGLSQQASVLTAFVYFALAGAGLLRPETEWAWLRGAMSTLLVLVGGAYLTLMSGDLTEPWSLLEHVVVPILVVVDYLVVGRTRGRWWWPATWTALPLAYLVYYVYGDVLLYDFLDPYAPDYQATVVGFLAATVAIGFLLLALARARQSTYDRDIS